MTNRIYEWKLIKEKYAKSMILRNGSSVAINNSFRYDSLYNKANELKLINSELTTLFAKFNTTDFEAILHKLLQASIVNHSLLIDCAPIDNVYNECRDALINVIQKIHPLYKSIDENQLDNIANFLKHFRKVISLNYDLIIYWAMYRGNLPIYDESGNIIEYGNIFKDGFV